MNNKSTFLNVIGWIFGAAVFFVGIVNTFWGNDPGFGVFILLLSLLCFPPVNTMLKEWTGFSVPGAVKILPGIFIFWAALGVGELFHKIDLMLDDLSNLKG